MKNSVIKKIIIFIIFLIGIIFITSKSFALTPQTEKVLGTENYNGIKWTKLEGNSKSVNVGSETKYNPGLEAQTGVIKYFTVTSGSSLVKVQKVKTSYTEYLLIKGLKAGTAKINVYYCPAGTVNEYKGIHKYSLKTLTLTVIGTGTTNTNQDKDTKKTEETKEDKAKSDKVKADKEENLDSTEYTITYYVDSKIYKTQKYKLGTVVTLLDAPKKEGYEFIEWNTSKDGTGNSRTAGYKLSVNYTKNITYYAIFKSKVEKIETSKISSLSKKGTTTSSTPIYSESGELIANMASGETFEILGEISNKYYKIKWTKNNVYVTVNSKYITVNNKVGTAKGIGVNIREKSSKSSNCFGDIVVGKVNINNKEGSYYNVNFEIEGFIKKDLVKLTENEKETGEQIKTSNLLNSLINITKQLLGTALNSGSQIIKTINENKIQSESKTIVDSTKTIISEKSTDTQKEEAIEKGIISTINIFSELTMSSLKLLNSYLSNI